MQLVRQAAGKVSVESKLLANTAALIVLGGELKIRDTVAAGPYACALMCLTFVRGHLAEKTPSGRFLALSVMRDVLSTLKLAAGLHAPLRASPILRALGVTASQLADLVLADRAKEEVKHG